MAVAKEMSDVVRLIPTETLTETNAILYATALVATEELGVKVPESSARKQMKIPPWRFRIEQKIRKWRKELSQLQELQRGRTSDETARGLNTKYRLKQRDIKEVCEDLKQKVVAAGKKIERYLKRVNQYQQNKMFWTDQKKVLQNLDEGKKQYDTMTPEAEATVGFWQGLWDKPVFHNNEAKWITNVEKSWRDIPAQPRLKISAEMVSKQVKGMKNWKAAGPEQVHAFWLKSLTSLHPRLANQMQEVLDGDIPEWLGKGRTVLIMKDKAKGPAVENYRPITCLPTTWKLLTGILSEDVYSHLEKNDLLPVEQKGCRKFSRGTKDQLLIDKLLLSNCRQRKVGLCTSWIDYKKAYDSVPHSWLLKCLEMMKVCSNTIRFLRTAMKYWKTELTANGEVMGECKIRRGIFQGDSLSPLLFVIAMIPLSKVLNSTGLRYQLEKGGAKINHLLYMDDLKLYGKGSAEIESLTKTVFEYSDDIGMEFGISKCATMVMKRGKMVESDGVILPDGQVVTGLKLEDSYKYLGMLEADSIRHTEMKKQIKTEYKRRVRKVLGSHLNAGNTMQAINVWAVSAFRYSAGIVDWTKAELKEVDTETRKLLTLHKAHHPRASTARLYLPREEGGRGLQSVEQAIQEDIRSIVEYLENSKETLLKKVIDEKVLHADGSAESFKKEQREERLKEWKEKALHGQYLREVEPVANKSATFKWIESGMLKKETEGLLVAAQDQALRTNAIKVKIDHQKGSELCRLCGQKEETVDHLVSSCSKIAQTDYKGRHDKVAATLHWSLCKQFGFVRAEKWYDHRAEKVLENEEFKLLWDYDIKTDKVIKERRPDLVIVKKKARQALIVDVAIPGDSRVAMKELEKKMKYRDLAVELQRLWEMKKVSVVPIVIGALGAIPPELPNHLKTIAVEDVTIEQLQRSAVLGTAYILRKYMQV